MTATFAIVVAAGAGSRLGDPGGMPKALRPIAGVPMYVRAARVFDRHPRIDVTVVVYPAIWEGHLLEHIGDHLSGPVELVAGGATRGASVRAGLALCGDADVIVIHDAARPFVDASAVDRVIDALGSAEAVVCAVPAVDTLARASDGSLGDPVARDDVVHVQTPQGFRAEVLRRAHDQALADGVEASDDAALVARLGVPVSVVEGDRRNIKVTTPADLAIAEALARAQEEA